jgi:hypothetical protein
MEDQGQGGMLRGVSSLCRLFWGHWKRQIRLGGIGRRGLAYEEYAGCLGPLDLAFDIHKNYEGLSQALIISSSYCLS